jgi:predicted AlkP superfamily phosphohydrolase/phosphomutase
MRVGVRAAALVLVAAVAAAILGCGTNRSPRRGEGKVLLIGLDGAEWNLIRPLMARGEMPNLKSLVDRGISGDLKSLEPLQKSPAIWTTIATGKPPEEHGIRTFVESKGGKPLTANIRRVKALWNILSAAGKTVGVVGWLMSWPAEQVNGFVVSDYIQYQAARTSRFENRTWPPGLYGEIESLSRDWKAMPWSEVNGFLSEPFDSASADSSVAMSLQPIKWMISADATFVDVALKLGRQMKSDFLAVYLRSMDTMGHLYWNYQSPESYPPQMTRPELKPHLKETMRFNYRWVDAQVGRLLELADEKTTVIVCSDHGFIGGGGGGVRDHRVEGVLILAGPHVARGEISGATVYDVTPTVLALFGLPRAQDMRGKVLWEVFDGFLKPEMFTKTLPTYESGSSAGGEASIPSPVDQELMERLRSLGYLK